MVAFRVKSKEKEGEEGKYRQFVALMEGQKRRFWRMHRQAYALVCVPAYRRIGSHPWLLRGTGAEQPIRSGRPESYPYAGRSEKGKSGQDWRPDGARTSACRQLAANPPVLCRRSLQLEGG